ncbi:gamma-glutamylcysteine synthetase [Plasmodium ovale wallikeri]|uniref:glutamate--cysteine ligase n=2 Tax=Plasmodium ovale TaxID=36330 RepID=A0A1A8YPF2_PLAOA|nr:gamma-glutamylcysteine synthetase [Plasmodium ovale wallikeri]SBT33922.1 gamma-glutamylcysteine synthetase [Plasmodium ovale wallikeri]SBT76382.1 gamma-glutamylcysteine synthetase, putative [Plasmodium ovale]
MGFLKIGTPLSWEEVQRVKSLIRLYGILQFVHTYKYNKDREDENIMFGDEIEYIIIRNDENLRESSALLCATDLIDEMMNLESMADCQYGSHWTPEYSSFTIEGTPSVPFKFDINSSSFIEDCMRIRRSKLNNVLSAISGVRAITLPCFPNSLLNSSLLMAKRINQENNKKKNEKNKGDHLETPSIENIRLNKMEKKNFEYTKCSNLQSECKISNNDTSQVDVEENKSTNFVNSDITFPKNDDLLTQEIYGEEADGPLFDETQVEEFKKEEKSEKEESDGIAKDIEQDMFINTIKGDSIFECELFKPEDTNNYSNSCLVTDMVISPHARYVTLTKNIRKRRGTKIISFNEIYKDTHTEQMELWNLSLDKSDRRLFKKIKKKYVLDDHLIWNKSMTNRKEPAYKVTSKGGGEASKAASRMEEQCISQLTVQYAAQEGNTLAGDDIIPTMDIQHNEEKDGEKYVVGYDETYGNKCDEENLMGVAIKNGLFSNVDDDKDYIYVYDRKFIEEYSEKCKNPIKNYVYLDAMFFGMSMCCQQLTMSFPTIDDAKYVYDQLAVIAPLFLAITASTPYLGGFLTETDTRWRVISNSVDCRTEEELAYISKPRYSGISLYISNELPLRNNYYFYNDIDVVLNKNVYDKLIKENVDDYLARHVSSLFVRDPIVVFEGSYSENDIKSVEKRVEELQNMGEKKKETNCGKGRSVNVVCSGSGGDSGSGSGSCSSSGSGSGGDSGSGSGEGRLNGVYLSEKFDFLEDYEEKVLSSHQHFENFQSTNWNSVRFKPPPILDNHMNNGPSSIGWRVEFRTPDIQITDFENASVVTLIMVLSKFIMKERLNLYIPMSMLEENLFRSANRDAITKEKFYFRKNLKYDTENNTFEEMSIFDIFFNEENGIFILCGKYIEEEFNKGLLTQTAKNKIDEYIEFVKLRCSGKICTGAAYLRNFIKNHPSYEKNSYINEKINYDICKLIADIGKGLIIPQELLGVFVDPYKERIKSDLRQINESQYLKSLAYKFISGEDYTQYLLLSEAIKDDQDYYTCTRRTNYEESMDNRTLEFGKKLYELSA